MVAAILVEMSGELGGIMLFILTKEFSDPESPLWEETYSPSHSSYWIGLLRRYRRQYCRLSVKNGQPFLMPGAKVVDHALEMSGASVSDDFTRIIEAQRAYSYALKMVQTSDEIVNTVPEQSSLYRSRDKIHLRALTY